MALLLSSNNSRVEGLQELASTATTTTTVTLPRLCPSEQRCLNFRGGYQCIPVYACNESTACEDTRQLYGEETVVCTDDDNGSCVIKVIRTPQVTFPCAPNKECGDNAANIVCMIVLIDVQPPTSNISMLSTVHRLPRMYSPYSRSATVTHTHKVMLA
jgi:hypothetical protein